MKYSWVIAVTCVFSAAQALAFGHSDKVAPKAVVILMDATKSTRTQQTRDVYVDAVRVVFESLQPGDALYAGWITDRSASELSLPVSFEIPDNSKKGKNPRVREAIRHKDIKDACPRIQEERAKLEQLLSRPPAKAEFTHIMSSLNLAQRVCAKSGRPRTVVVILSDMLEDTEDLDFDEVKLTSAKRVQIISSERAAGRLPLLSGAHIYVVGASAESDDRVFEVRAFWMEYFTATGAQLLPEDYGPLFKFETDPSNACSK